MSTVILLHNDICEAAETDNSLDMCVLISNLVSDERQEEVHSPDEYNIILSPPSSRHHTPLDFVRQSLILSLPS